MKYLSIDIETTGLDPEVNQMIEVGVVLADTADFNTDIDELPTFRALIPYKNYVINTFCMRMHKQLFDDLDAAAEELAGADHYSPDGDNWVCKPKYLFHCFETWLQQHDMLGQKLTVAGKNFQGFDAKFLKPLLPRVKFHHRTIDPVMLYARPGDKELPNLETCCKRAFIKIEGHHSAVADAKTVVKLVRCGLHA